MKTKLNMLMLTLIAMFACLSLSSCDKDNDPVGSAYVQLSSVDTNCIDANGISIASAVESEWITTNKADSQGKVLIGKTSLDRAEELFDQNIASMMTQFNDLYAGKNLLPESGYITYHFSLIFNNAAIRHASITVTNEGAN